MPPSDQAVQHSNHPGSGTAQGTYVDVRGVTHRFDPPERNSTCVCPVCNSNNVALLETISLDRLAHEWERDLEIDVTGECGPHHEMIRYQCSVCQLCFFQPESLAGSGEFYQRLQQFPWYYMPDKWEHQIAAPWIQSQHQVLEIGCAEGTFLEKIQQQGAHAQGVELNPTAVKIARQKGLDVQEIDVAQLAELKPGAFDAVCSFQVLEHVVDPSGFLQAATQLVRPGGKLIFCVPNQDSFLKHQWNLLNMPPHHLTQWTEHAFRQLQSVLPIRLVDTQFEPLASYHVRGFVDAYAGHYRSQSRLHRLMWSRWMQRVYRLGLRLGLRRLLRGQSILVVFEKRSENK